MDIKFNIGDRVELVDTANLWESHKKYVGTKGTILENCRVPDVLMDIDGKITTFLQEELVLYQDKPEEVTQDNLQVKTKVLSPDAIVPTYATPGSACFDLVCTEDTLIKPGETKAISTGLSFEIPEGYKMCIYPRSGVSLKTPLRIANSPAQVDSDYRGEVKVLLWNSAVSTRLTHEYHTVFDPDFSFDSPDEFPNDTYRIFKGDRIAQAEIVPVIRAEFELVDSLSETQRGAGGFGHTGTR